MSEQKLIWELYRGDTLLGILSNIEYFDFPWYRCKFQPTPAFEQYKPLFDHVSALSKDKDADEEWSMAYEKILELGLTLRDPNPARTTDISLHHIHIDGDIAEVKALFR